MIERVFPVTQSDKKTIEVVVDDDHAMINHIILAKGDAVPEHDSNSNVYLIVARGEMTIALGPQEAQVYPAGRILAVPYQTRMRISNAGEQALEFFVVKAPNPKVLLKESGKAKKSGGA